MSEYRYENFLDKHNVYHLLIAHWTKQVNKILNNIDYIDIKRLKYLKDRFNDNTLFYDGNPIFNLAIPSKKKAFRIVQLSPREYDEFYSSWVNEIDLELFAGQEKVIALTLTPNNRRKALSEISQWLVDNQT